MTAVSRFRIDRILSKVVRGSAVSYYMPVPTTWIGKEVTLMLKVKVLPTGPGHAAVPFPTNPKHFEGKEVVVALSSTEPATTPAAGAAAPAPATGGERKA